jgi:lysophospholipase L1-like esterase
MADSMVPLKIIKNMQARKISIFLFFQIIILISCKKEIETNPKVNFASYVAVGNSLTAGVANNGLYNESIKNAYPNLIAQQLKLVGGSNFPQANFATDQENGTGYLKFKGYNGFVPNIAQEITKTAIVSLQPPKLAKYVGDNQNLGMPFMKMAEIDDKNIRNFNLFFDRLLPDNAQPISYLQLLEKQNPTFFTCWLGNNDVLNFASSGGKSPITDVALFTSNLKKLLDQLTKNGAKGAVANIGDITSVPAITLLSSFRPLFSNTKFYVQTKNGVREGTNKDYLLLPNNLNTLNLNSLAAKGTDIAAPWTDAEVLDSDEVAIAQKAVLTFNEILTLEAKERNLALVDAFSFLNKLKNGITENGETVDASYISGGIFSLDGAHLTAKGNAFTANEYIKAINAYYKTSIPLLDTKLYKGVVAE